MRVQRGSNFGAIRAATIHSAFLSQMNIERNALEQKRLTAMTTMEGFMVAQTTDQNETASLIGSDKVEGTSVYRANGENIGTIQRVMIDKRSGKVAYAVMSFGGFMGIGEDYYPLPWNRLTYNERLGGYEANIAEPQLTNAPKYGQNQNWDWTDQRTREIDTYYSGI